MVGCLPHILLQTLWSLALLQPVEGHVKRLRISGDYSKLGPNGLPAKCVHGLFDLDSVDKDLLLTHVEDLEVVHTGVLAVLVLHNLLVPVNLDTQILFTLLRGHPRISNPVGQDGVLE